MEAHKASPFCHLTYSSPLPSLLVFFFAVLFALFIPFDAALPAATVNPFHFIRAIAIDPEDTKTVYIASENQGLIKSLDGGTTWKFINNGIKNYLIYDVKISRRKSGQVYAAAWGGGFYESDNGGASWQELNEGLINTAIGSIVLAEDKDQERAFVGTSTQVHQFQEKEKSWKTLTNGLSLWNGPQFQSLVAVASNPILLFMGTEKGLYKKTLGTDGWMEIKGMKGKRITALLYNPLSKILYAGTVSSGGIYMSRDLGASWTASGAGLERSWTRDFAAHPSNAKIVYAATTDRGVIKSNDAGKTWETTNEGLTLLDARAIAIDPKDPEVLYVGIQGPGIFKSIDGGITWKKQTDLPFNHLHQQLADITLSIRQEKRAVAPPASFVKCNKCHGWTDPILNQKKTYWRTAANRRDWHATVTRMSDGSEISGQEQSEIVTFLEKYTGQTPKKKATPSPSKRR